MNGPSPHLSWAEIACHDRARTPYPERWRASGGRAEILARCFEAIRERLGNQPLTVLSGFRTTDWNQRVGGAPNSFHMQGMAIDIKTPVGMTPDEMVQIAADIAESLPIGGIGRYPWGIHVDIRTLLRGPSGTRRVLRWRSGQPKESGK